MKSARQFVIQKHTKASEVHWDLMLEDEGILKTYRFELPPEKLPHQKTTATKIFDHPSKFLTYEGSVNDELGSVKIVDAGTYRTLTKGDECWELRLDGKALKGEFTLTHLEGDKWKFSSS